MTTLVNILPVPQRTLTALSILEDVFRVQEHCFSFSCGMHRKTLHTDLLFAASLVFWMLTVCRPIRMLVPPVYQHAVAGRSAFSTKQKHASRRQCMRNSDIVITVANYSIATA